MDACSANITALTNATSGMATEQRDALDHAASGWPWTKTETQRQQTSDRAPDRAPNRLLKQCRQARKSIRFPYEYNDQTGIQTKRL